MKRNRTTGGSWLIFGALQVYDRKLNEKKYKIGNKLLIRKEIGNKLQPLYEGPYEVIEINEPNVTILKNGKTKDFLPKFGVLKRSASVRCTRSPMKKMFSAFKQLAERTVNSKSSTGR